MFGGARPLTFAATLGQRQLRTQDAGRHDNLGVGGATLTVSDVREGWCRAKISVPPIRATWPGTEAGDCLGKELA
jgi:hypothetical protein